MKFKTFSAILAAAALTLGCFSGCSRKAEQNQSAAPQTAAAPEGTTAAVPTAPTDEPGGQTAPEQNRPQGGMPGREDRGGMHGKIRLGQVTAIDGASVTLALEAEHMHRGRDDMNGQSGTMPTPPDGQSGTMPTPPDGQSGTMPTPPDGQSGTMPTPPDGQSGTMPTPPDGQSGTMPTPPDGQSGATPNAGKEDRGQRPEGGKMDGFRGFTAGSETVTVTVEASVAATLQLGDLMIVTYDDSGAAVSAEKLDRNAMGGPGGFGGPGGMPGGPGGQGSASNGTAANTAEADAEGETYVSEAADENALRVDGRTVALKEITLTKTGDSSNTETSDFYGMNAGLLATNGADVTVTGGSFTTDGAGANALFSYGAGTTLTVKDSVVRTSARNSGGIQTAGGGTTVAENLDVETAGASSAAIRSDRGGGTVNVTGGSYTTNGTGSPAIYSTAEITVNGAALTANASEGVVVEGKNSVTLNDCALTGNMQGTYGRESSENLQAVMIYQSMSGDATMGAGSFTMNGGSLTAKAGDLFYVTNTTAAISLRGVDLKLADGVLLRASGNDGSRGWGASGSNGATVTMQAASQKLTGVVYVDAISSLELTLTEQSVFEGTVNPDGAAGRVTVRLEAGSTWKLTADAYVSAFDGDLSAVEANGFRLYVGGEQKI